MTLWAVVGGVGSGKTTRLEQMAAECRPDVTGFLARAGSREIPHQGADDYTLCFLPNGEEHLFAVRDAKLMPPYQFLSSAVLATQRWADSLIPGQVKNLILDEFGRIEAEGKGHIELWPKIAAAEPERVILGVRLGCEEAIQDLLGCPFDHIIRL